MMDVSPFVLTIVKWSLITIVLIAGLFVLNRTRTFAKGTNGKKLSFNKKRVPYDAEIVLDKSQRYNPSIIGLTVSNTGTKDIDLSAPVIIFKRWFSKRKFKVIKVEHSEIYPLLLGPGKIYELDISLDQFYEAVPELQLACRLSIEMKDQNGKRFKSQTIRLKLF